MSEAVVEAASGVVGSIIALLATYPLKTIYTLQALNSNATQAPGILDIVLRYKLGLYVGIEPNIVESGLSSGVYFYLYSKLRSHAVSKRKAASASNAPGVAPASSKDQDIGFLASLLVPAIAAVGNQLLTMPASVVATRMQALKKSHMDGHSPNSPTVSSVIKGVWAESGIGGFWAGLLPSLVLISNPSIQFMLYEQLLRALRTWKRRCLMPKLAKEQQSAQVEAKVAMNWHAVSPNSTGSVGNIQPVDTTTLDNTDGASKGVQGEVVALDDNGSSASSGSSGWHTTEQTTLLGYEYNGPGSISPGHHPKVGGGTQAARPQSVQRAGRAGSGDKAAQQIPPIRLAAWETFLASALSKIGATLATYWLVVVKSRMQAASKSRPDEQYKGTLDALVRIWREEGMGGFSKGLGAKLIQTALNAALMLMLKEQVYIKTRQLLTSPGLADRMRQHLVG